MRYKIESMVSTLLNTILVLFGVLTWVILMVTTGSVLITTVITIIVTLGTIPIMAYLNNRIDDYLSKYWVETHKQGKEHERDEVKQLIGWRFQHKIFEDEVEVFDINGTKDSISVRDLITKELNNNPVTNNY